MVYEAEDNHVYGEGVTKTSSHHRVVDYFPVRAHCQTFLSWRNYYDLWDTLLYVQTDNQSSKSSPTELVSFSVFKSSCLEVIHELILEWFIAAPTWLLVFSSPRYSMNRNKTQ